MSGFSGSAGTLIVRQEEAYLWTDGRYFIQAEKELAGSCIQLMKMRTPGVPTIKEYVEKYPEATIGFDGRVMPYNQCLFTNTIQANEDLVDLIWQERPELSHEEVYLYDTKYCKPQTFMNLSGECVQPLAAWHRLLPENILVVHDELDIAPGRMKFKKGGGNAGHNGLKSITQRLGTPDFYRLRLGIGRSPHGGEDTVNWVLGRLSPEAQDAFRKQLPAALEVVRLFAEGNIPAATHAANAFVIE